MNFKYEYFGPRIANEIQAEQCRNDVGASRGYSYNLNMQLNNFIYQKMKIRLMQNAINKHSIIKTTFNELD